MILQDTLAWAKSEQIEGAVVAIFALLVIVVAILAHKFIHTPYAKALLIPLVVVGVAYAVIGVGIIYNATQAQNQATKQMQSMTDIEFAKQEQKRVQGFEKSYFASKITTTMCFLCAVLLLWFAKSPLWQSVGIALVLFGFVAIVVDYFSKERADIYFNALVKFTS